VRKNKETEPTKTPSVIKRVVINGRSDTLYCGFNGLNTTLDILRDMSFAFSIAPIVELYNSKSRKTPKNITTINVIRG
jgi:hypothetical protein